MDMSSTGKVDALSSHSLFTTHVNEILDKLISEKSKKENLGKISAFYLSGR